MPRPPENFATERLVARLPRMDDATTIFGAYASDPAVTRYLAWRNYSELEPLRDFLRGVIHTWENGAPGHYAWLLCLRGTDVPIGSIGVGFDLHGAVAGYVLEQAHWGQSLMAEALRYLTAWTLAQPPLHRVWAYCDAENRASARVMEKAGWVREGLLRRWHVCPTIGPEPRDCLIYAKVR